MVSGDATVVGSGPNGLAGAITLARAGLEVRVLEGADTIGGGTRTAELTLSGFRHDICSAIHPLAMASPFFAGVPLEDHGVRWIEPPFAVAHPLDDGSAGHIERSLDRTVAALGVDGRAYRRLVGHAVENWQVISDAVLAPLLTIPKNPFTLARFGLPATAPAAPLARRAFKTARGQALFAGLAAHSIVPLTRPLTASFAVVLAATAHVVGWPFPAGGSDRIAAALSSYLETLGGRVETGHWVDDLASLEAPLTLLDVTPRQIQAMAGDLLPGRIARSYERFRYGPGVFKVDYALDGPVPWTAEACFLAGTVHVGGTLDEITAAEAAVGRGELPDRPFVLVAQQSSFDDTRAPAGKHTLWAYCHVPAGSTFDMTGRIEAQIERFAPGFRDLVLDRHVMNTEAIHAYNPNYILGDISGGSHGGLQSVFRPRLTTNPYATGIPGVYLCSSSTPPGAGVHGMCGFHSANTALVSSVVG